MSSGPERSQSRLSNIDFERSAVIIRLSTVIIESPLGTVSLGDRKFGPLGPVMVCLVSRASVMNTKCCVTDHVTWTGVMCDLRQNVIAMLCIITGIRKLPGYDN